MYGVCSLVGFARQISASSDNLTLRLSPQCKHGKGLQWLKGRKLGLHCLDGQNHKCIQMTEACVLDVLCNGLPTGDRNSTSALQHTWLLPELKHASYKAWLHGQDFSKKLRPISDQNCSTVESIPQHRRNPCQRAGANTEECRIAL